MRSLNSIYTLYFVLYTLYEGGGAIYDELVKLISNVGFPVAVSVYLLVKLDKRLEQIIMMLSAMEHRERERKS